MMPEIRAAAIRRPHPWASWSLGAVGAGFILFLAAAAVIPVREVIRADGRVILTAQSRTVAPRQGGTVADILVREGDEVNPGQILLRIENRRAGAALGETAARIAALSVRALRLEAEADGRDAVAIPRSVETAAPEAVSLERWLFRIRRESLMSELAELEQGQRRQEQELAVRQEAIARLETKLAALRARLGDRQGAAEHRTEIAQDGGPPIEVPRPGPNQTVSIAVVAGRPLKIAFDVDDVKRRGIANDDLVLEFDNGGKVVLKDYMTAFGKLGEVRTIIIRPDGRHYAFTELLAPSTGRRGEPPAPGTPGDAVIVQRPPAREKRTYRLTEERPVAVNFGFREIASARVDANGDLVLTFKNGAVLALERYAELRDKGVGVYFAKGDKIALADLARAAAPARAIARLGEAQSADSGDGAHPEVSRLRREIEDTERELAAARQEIPRIQAAIAEARRKRAERMSAFVADARKDRGDTEREIARLEERRAKLSLDAKPDEVRAPLRGIVKRLRAAKGAAVEAGEPLAEIAPLDDAPVVEGRVRPEDIALVRAGQRALVRIADSGDAARSALEGKVIEVGSVAIETPARPGETYFRVKIGITLSLPEGDGKRLALRPGMAAEAAIEIGSKSLLTYILTPATAPARRIKVGESLPDNGTKPPAPGRSSAESL